jgi:hypothetical protein
VIEVMARPLTYRIVDCPDGRFAIVVVAASGTTYRRDGLYTLAEAEACVEDLRAALTCCSAVLARHDEASDARPGTGPWGAPSGPRPPIR